MLVAVDTLQVGGIEPPDDVVQHRVEQVVRGLWQHPVGSSVASPGRRNRCAHSPRTRSCWT